MLATLTQVQAVPELAIKPVATLTFYLSGADTAIKTYLKRNPELNTYTEFFSGTGQRDIILKQYPVSNSPPPQVWFDPNGYWGQSQGGFASGTLLTQGTQWALILDSGGQVSNRGLIRRIGGTGQGFIGFYPETFFSGKLSAYRLPIWPRGDGNIRVTYTAGYSVIPMDLSLACVELVAWLVRNVPNGAALSSETLGQYSYSVLMRPMKGDPILGTINRTLAFYRESSW